MTRINLIDPSYLLDMHLRGEYKELTRVFTYVMKARASGKTDAEIASEVPSSFRLGSGHVKFFYDKLAWVFNRYHLIVNEMRRRGFNLNDEQVDSIRMSHLSNFFGSSLWNSYYPTPEDIYLSMARLVKMSKMENVLAEVAYV